MPAEKERRGRSGKRNASKATTITNVDSLKFDIIHFDEKANKTIALEIIEDILFIATENGTIIRYNLTESAQMRSIVIPDAREIPQLERDQNNYLWCMDAGENRIFFIENPAGDISNNTIKEIPTYQLSRLYSGSDGWVYGRAFRVQYNNLSKNIVFEDRRKYRE